MVPSDSISANTAPTAITSFGWHKISVITPVQGDGTSESTLSVPISKIVSSISTASPI